MSNRMNNRHGQKECSHGKNTIEINEEVSELVVSTKKLGMTENGYLLAMATALLEDVTFAPAESVQFNAAYSDFSGNLLSLVNNARDSLIANQTIYVENLSV